MRAGGAGARSALGPADFRRVYRAGRRYSTSVATVHVLDAESRSLRVGVPVGKRLGSAVVRNRIRRRLREAFRRVEVELQHGADIVIVARSPAATIPFNLLVCELREAMREAGLAPI